MAARWNMLSTKYVNVQVHFCFGSSTKKKLLITQAFLKQWSIQLLDKGNSCPARELGIQDIGILKFHNINLTGTCSQSGYN